MTSDPISSSSSTPCTLCEKEGIFMCSSCGREGPRYCSSECQTQHWKTKHYKTCKAVESIQLQDLSNRDQDQNQNQDQDQDQEEEEDLSEDLRFYTNQIYRIIKPVVACIILSIFWVKVAFSGDSDYSPTRPSYVQITTTSSSSTSSSSSSSSSNLGSSFINAAIIIGQIIGVTIIIVFLFKKGWMKVLIGFFMIVVVLLLGFMTYLLLLNLIQVFFIPLDYITMVFALWNFAMVGLVSIFWKGPLWLQQCYLTIMSSLMAFSLTGLEQWTTWILLGLLAAWDLIAVLCPFGPLRLLLESSKTQQRDVPALLYSVNAVWFMMASGDHVRLSNSMLGRHSMDIVQSLRPSSFIRRSHDGFVRLSEESQPQLQPITEQQQQQQQQRQQQQQPSPPQQKEVENDEEDAERSGLKLGLGDFVFYSVLIARAAMYDWITTVCCTIAVLTGLTATIFLLAIYKKALPALPISIAFGILFYFVAKQVLVPYIGTLCVFGMVGL